MISRLFLSRPLYLYCEAILSGSKPSGWDDPATTCSRHHYRVLAPISAERGQLHICVSEILTGAAERNDFYEGWRRRQQLKIGGRQLSKEP